MQGRSGILGAGRLFRKKEGDTLKSDSRLAVNLLGIQMNAPVMTASGTFGFGEEFADFTDLEALGAVVVKGTTLQPRRGNDGVRIAETPAGMLNCIGLENPGVDYFLQTILPRISKYHMNVIVNVSGGSAEEYGQLAERLDVPGVAAIELNVSCPNVKDGGIIFGTDPKAAAEVVTQAKKHTKKPVILKLSPNVTDIAEMARAGEAAGADALSLINTLMGMAIDIRTWRPVLGNLTGGLSGPCVKPVALRMVWQASQAVKIPIIGMGGIMTAEDAVEFFLAGASAIAVGTANFCDPSVTKKIICGLEDYLEQRKLSHISDIVGQLIVDKE
ncbi:MAG: dihydroorotate dehydrogenase [Schwartzia sp.]|nr:dihydroorotate dehydrogenase [Schwartzia sp. (in: firmicutes)]